MKTVWILGAGFSKEAGYPIVWDFLNPGFFIQWILRHEINGMGHVIAPATMQQVEYWSKLGDDLNKLMSEFLDQGDFKNVRDLNQFILTTLQMISLHQQDVYRLPYLEVFANHIGATNSSVISFNYDTLVEEKICHYYVEHHYTDDPPSSPPPTPYTLGFGPDTCLSITDSPNYRDYGSGFLPFALPSQGDLKILKVHGSTCLWYCHDCLGAIYRTPTGSDPVTFYFSFR